MIIYGELLFLENLIIGGVLLYITAMIHGRTAGGAKQWLRLLIGSLMCGAFSMVIFLNIKAPALMLAEAVFAMAVCGVVFKDADNCNGDSGTISKLLKRIPWRCALTFILVTYFMGGITMGLLLVTDNTGIYTAAGIYTGDMKAGVLALFTGVSFITAKQVIKTVKARKLCDEYVFSAVISIDEITVEAQAFLDTGNSLRDPVTGKPVAVASDELWRQLRGCSSVYTRFVIIPYETVESRGLLNAVRTDYIKIAGKQIKGCVVAGSDGSFKGAGCTDCDLLISEKMLEPGIMP